MHYKKIFMGFVSFCVILALQFLIALEPKKKSTCSLQTISTSVTYCLLLAATTYCTKPCSIVFEYVRGSSHMFCLADTALLIFVWQSAQLSGPWWNTEKEQLHELQLWEDFQKVCSWLPFFFFFAPLMFLIDLDFTEVHFPSLFAIIFITQWFNIYRVGVSQHLDSRKCRFFLVQHTLIKLLNWITTRHLDSMGSCWWPTFLI